MTDHRLHTFAHPVDAESLPRQFNCPFHYTPHPLCEEAAGLVQTYLSEQTGWREELENGKMFGVLVVETADKEIGFLAAYSGILMGSNQHAYFVPPVYNLLDPNGFFKPEEAEISAINLRISDMEASDELHQLQHAVLTSEEHAAESLKEMRMKMKEAKAERAARRKSNDITPEKETELIRESQFQKAEYKRLEHALLEETDRNRSQLAQYIARIDALKQERKMRSAALQQKLFEQFVVWNARGEQKDLCEIFTAATHQIPPAGAGECAAPKLLQYAFLHQMRPVCMAEFWWGKSPKKSIRRHGNFYPSCKSKCEPILGHMLQGLDVEENPLTQTTHASQEIEILYEDEYLVILNKPEGMLSVPGKDNLPSVWEFTRNRYPEADGPLIVHRLDMATSGILVLAKQKEVHQRLQAQFEQRMVKKRYTAVLEGEVTSTEGIIRLPLSPDYDDRPRQIVDHEHGKDAVTRYRVESVTDGRTRILFWPFTGRTHQLRVHAAHAEGLDCPMVGDTLYGRPDRRLFLHADYLEFRHPMKGNVLRIHCAAPF